MNVSNITCGGNNIGNNGSTTRVLLVSYSVVWAANSTNSRQVYIGNTANSNQTGYSAVGGAGGGGVTAQTGSAIVQLPAGQALQIQVYQNSGAALNVVQAGTWISVVVL